MKSISQSPPSTIPDRGAMSEVQARRQRASRRISHCQRRQLQRVFEARDWDRSAPIRACRRREASQRNPCSSGFQPYVPLLARLLRRRLKRGTDLRLSCFTVRFEPSKRLPFRTRPRSFWTHMERRRSWFPHGDTTGLAAHENEKLRQMTANSH